MARSRSPPQERDRSPDPKRRRQSHQSSSRRDRSPSPSAPRRSGYDDDRHSSSRHDRRDRDPDSRRDRDKDRDVRDRDRRDRDRYPRDDYRDRDRERHKDRDRDGRRAVDRDDRDSRGSRDDTERVRDAPSLRDAPRTDSPVHSTSVVAANGRHSIPTPSSSRMQVDSPRIATPASPSMMSGGGSPATLGSPAPQSEEEKQRAKREKLEAWKRAQAAKKAAQDGANTSSTPTASSSAIPSGSKLPALPSSLPGKPAFGIPAATLSRIGLPLKPSANTTARSLPSSVAAMDDTDTSNRKLQKLALPPVDPLMLPGSSVPGGTVTENLDVVDESDDDDAMDVDKVPPTAAAEEEEEEDPLDAFMKENTKEVIKVDAEDEKKFGKSAATVRQEVLNLSDDETELEDEELPTNNGVLSSEEILALAAKKAKKKEMPTIDHSEVKYEPFRKAFYVPNDETNALDEDDVDLMRMEMDGIKIRGQDCPKPVRNWGAFGLPAGCYDVIRRLGYTAPTPIQAQAIPAIMSGRDIIGVAKTGSGKTIAFLLPLFRHIKDQRPLENGEGPMALIMTPTRELATQIWRESKPFLTALNMRAVCAYGGSNLSEQIADFKKGAEVVVCTPGRMIDVLTANSGRVTNLRRVTYLVLDEADRMFDMGFEPQVMKIINNIRPDRQTLLFSATFPQKMDALARKILTRPLEITVGGRSVVAKEIDQRVEVRSAESKFLRLLEILGEMGEKFKDEDDFRTLIFVDRQDAADDLFKELMRKGYICVSLHGGKDQVDRDQAIADFKAGFVPIVVATSVAARGLDVKELKLVINYDCPNHMEDYVHRAGRTGRAGNTGVCVTFITPEQERYSVDLQRALKASGAYIPPELQKMAEDFLAKVKEGKAKTAGSGFGGKGLDKFDAERDAKDRAQRSAYGEDGTGPDKQAETAKTTDSGSKEAAPPKIDFNVEIVRGPAPDKLPSGPTKPAAPSTPLELGMDVPQLPPQTLAALQRAEAAGRGSNVKENLASAVAKIQASLRNAKAERAGTGATLQKAKDPDATDFHAIVPINDYPQKARWKATNKEQMVQLIELSGASITNKGIFYEAGKEPGPGQEPKLHLLIESNEEFRVKLAVDELRRILLEASVAAIQNESRAPMPQGRYQV